MSYRSQHCRHEFVRLLGLDEAAHFQDTSGQAGNDGRMLGQRLLENLAVLLIVFERAYFGYATEALKGS